MNATERPACELCGSEDPEPLYTHTLRAVAPPMVRCGHCGLIFISPRPLREVEEAFYQHEYYETAIKSREYASRLDLFEHYLTKIRQFQAGGTILDVGCGPGHFLQKAGEQGWEAYGVEISEKAAGQAPELGGVKDIFQGSLLEARYPDAFFDVVTLYNVLDQLAAPRATLQEVHRILRPGGLLVVRVPNSNFHHPFKTGIDFLGRRGLLPPPISLTPFHLFQFSPVTLRRLAEQCGFEAVHLGNAKVSTGDPGKTYGPSKEKLLHFLKKALSGLCRLVYYLTLGKAIVGPSLELYAVKKDRVPMMEVEPVEVVTLREEGMSEPMVSIVIPSKDASRAPLLEKLLGRLRRQDYGRMEVVSVRGVFPQGKAINLGVSRTRGEILLIFDDDSGVDDPGLVRKLVAVLQADPRIGMAGASIRPPAHSTRFQKRAAAEFPRFSMPVAESATDSDLPCHGCCALRAAVFREVGGEREDLTRGLDPVLRQKIRGHGYRVVLAPAAVAYHEVPGSLAGLMRIFHRNGRGSAECQVFHPELAYDTEDSLETGGPQGLRKPFPFRIARFALRLSRALLTGRFIRFAAYSAYAVGYVSGYVAFQARKIPPAAN